MRARFINELLNKPRKKNEVEELQKELGLSDEEFEKLTVDDIMKLLSAPQAAMHAAASEKELQKELKDVNKALIFDPKNQCYGYIDNMDRKNHIANIVCTHTLGFKKLPQPKKDKISYNEYDVDDKYVGSLERRYKRLVNKIKHETQKVQTIKDMVDNIEKIVKSK